MRSANFQYGETENNQLRRNTMNSTRVIFAIFAAAAVIIGGCSGNDRITGSGTDVLTDVETTQQVFSNVPTGETNSVELTAEAQGQKIERFDFEATVKRTDIEGGCWYLETDDDVRYTPYFEMGAPKLSVGDRIQVFGYIDENMNSYCMIGSVFHVEKFTRLYRDDDEVSINARTDAEKRAAVHLSVPAADEYQPNSNEAAPEASPNSLSGYFGATEKGCYYIYDEKGIIAELYFVQRICPDIQDGTPITVTGAYSLLTWSPCQMARLFNVEKFQVEEENHSVANEGIAGK